MAITNEGTKLQQLMQTYQLLETVKKEQETQLKATKTSQKEVEQTILGKMRDLGTTQLRSTQYGMTFTDVEDQVPNVNDWDAVWEHIVTSGDTHLVQRRIGLLAWREMLDHGIEIPGIESFTRHTLRMRGN
jgi:hypothetical protein